MNVNILNAANKVLGPFFTPNVVSYILGEPSKIITDFSTLPNDITTHGTAESGVLYNYKERPFNGMNAYVLWDKDLGYKKVPQDSNYNNGINPYSGLTYLDGVHIHPARIGSYDTSSPYSPDGSLYNSGSWGCITGFGGSFNLLWDYLDVSPTGGSGNTIIFRYSWDYGY